MPRMTQLAEAEVFAAIRDLVEHGEYPTSARLRERLEHRGSPVVLQRFLASWYEQFGPELARKADSAPKKGKTAGLEAELRRLTADAVQEVEAAQRVRIDALDHREQQLDEREKQLEAREANLRAREGKLDERELAQHELVRTITASSAAASQTKDEALAALAAAEAQVAVHSARIADLERAVAHTETLKRELAGARKDLAREQARVAELVPVRDAALQRANEEAAARAKLAGALGAREEADQQRLAELAAARSELAEAGARIAALASQLDATKVELATAAAAGAASSEECAELRASMQEVKLQMDGVQARNESLLGLEEALNRQEAQVAARIEALLKQQAATLIDKIGPLLRKEKTKGT